MTERSIRVFISSTFADMQEERETLITRIFPAIRAEAASRHVGFFEVDLRWGITEEQSRAGETLAICLVEIERCRPFFIGLLGERYGWVPAEGTAGKKSITEMEIDHGVLQNPAMAGRTFFYLRDPAWVQSIPAERRAAFLSDNPDDAGRLQELKRRIRASGLPVRENYRDPAQLGELVTADLMRILDEEYPAGKAVDGLDRDLWDHEGFAASRARVFTGREQDLALLEAHAEESAQPLVVAGPRGAGKSALLARWVLLHRESCPHDIVIARFTGATSHGVEPGGLLRSVLLELKRCLDLPLEVPELAQELAASLGPWLAAAAAKRKIILVIDGLERLQEEHPFRDLSWLPSAFPPGVRVLLSACPGPCLQLLRASGCRVHDLAPLDAEGIRQLSRTYLGVYRKSLTAEQQELIAAAGPATSPLHLQLLLEELRLFGEHERVTARLQELLAAGDTCTLIRGILQRLAHDHWGERPGLVREVLSLVWASRDGLPEAEAVDMLELPRIAWSRLCAALGPLVEQRAGRLVVRHDDTREAIRQEYMADAEAVRSAHRRLADFLDLRGFPERRTEELCWQLAEAGEWKRLEARLCDLAELQRLWSDDPLQVIHLWTRLEQGSSARARTAYPPLFEQARRSAAHQETLYSLLLHLGHLPEAAQAAMIDTGSTGGKATDRQLNQVGVSWLQQGRADLALPLLAAVAERIEGRLGPRNPLVARAWCNLAAARQKLGQDEKAIHLYEAALDVLDEARAGESTEAEAAVQDLGVAHYNRKEYEEAARLFQRALAIQARLRGPVHPDAAVTCNDLANSLAWMGRYPEAAQYHEKALAIRTAVYGDRHTLVADTLFGLGNVLDLQEFSAVALERHQQALDIRAARLGESHAETVRSRQVVVDLGMRWLQRIESRAGLDRDEAAAADLRTIASALMSSSQFEPAARALGKAVEILSGLHGRESDPVAEVFGDLGSLHERMRRPDTALEFYRMALAIRTRTLGAVDDRVAGLQEGIGVLYRTLGKLDLAEDFLKSCLTVRMKLYGPGHPDVAQAFNNLGGLCFRAGRPRESAEYLRRALESLRACGAGEKPQSATTHFNLGMVLARLGENSEAIACLREALGMRRRIFGDDHPDTLGAAKLLREVEQRAGG